MNYQEELKRLEEGGSYWKPKVGQYKVKGLSELEDAEPFKSKDSTESRAQAKVKILVNTETKIWTMGKGLTPASAYGQLCKLATEKGNTLMNVEFSVVVKNDGKKNDYTIVI